MAEKEYIEREAVLEIVKRTSGDYAAAFAEIRALPTADMVEVVRCRDCIRCKKSVTTPGMYLCSALRQPQLVYSDHYCSYGERKEATP